MGSVENDTLEHIGMAGLLKSLGNTVDAQVADNAGLGVGYSAAVLAEPVTALVVTIGVHTAIVGHWSSAKVINFPA